MPSAQLLVRARRRAAVAGLLALALAGCAPAPPRIDAFPAVDAAARASAFRTVWETVRDRYYDPALNGVDWQAVHERYRHPVVAAADEPAFWRALQRMTAELRDAHTRVHDPLQALARRREESLGTGIGLQLVGDQVAVASVEPDSEAHRLGVLPGDLVTAIDGLPTALSWQRWRETMGETSTERASRWRWLRETTGGLPGTRLALTLAREHRTFDVALPRKFVAATLKVKATRLPSGVGLVAFNRFRMPLASELRAAINGLGAVGALVIDLRGNGGGSTTEVRSVLESFLPARTRYAQSWTRATGPGGAGRPIDLTRAVPEAPVHAGPLVVLVDGRSASGAELFASALQEQLGATVVGSPTCGCVLGIRQYLPLPGDGELAVSEIGFLTPRGRRLEGTGVVPDLIVEPTLADLRDRADPALAAALRLLGAPPGVDAAAPPAPDTPPTTETSR